MFNLFLINEDEIAIGLFFIKVIFLFFKYLATIEFLPFLSYPLREKTTNLIDFTNFFQSFHL